MISTAFRGCTSALPASIITCCLTSFSQGHRAFVPEASVCDMSQMEAKESKSAQIRPQHGCRCHASSLDLAGPVCNKTEVLENGHPALLWKRATPVTVAWFAGRMWNNNTKWCDQQRGFKTPRILVGRNPCSRRASRNSCNRESGVCGGRLQILTPNVTASKR